MMKTNTLLIEEYLDELFINPKCELEYNKDYELLIAVMLSARTTDKGVNKVTRILFNKYDSLEKLAYANIDDLKEIIKPIGNYNIKSKNIINISKILLDKYNGVVPNNLKELESMDGIGRKCANVVLGELYNIPSFAVDTHVLRVSNRLALVKSDNPVIVEEKLKRLFKKEEWVKLHKQLVLFGRYQCKSKNPSCLNCKLKNICKYNKSIVKK